MNHIKRFFAFNVLLFTACLSVHADTVTFESIPGGTPIDGMTIDNQFEAEFGVRFSLEGGGAPVLAQVGGPLTAFQGYNGQNDNPAPGTNVGSYFLTDTGSLSAPSQSLIIDYVTAVSAASGIVLDIDQNEASPVST